MRARQMILPRTAKCRATGLLDMMYTPDDLAQELGITKRDIYHKLIPAGLPHIRDESGHVWIYGPEVAKWIDEIYQGRSFKLGEGEAYCLRCNKGVMMVNPQCRQVGRLTILQGTCPDCGAKVNRGAKLK